jgi:hypothetical protein
MRWRGNEWWKDLFQLRWELSDAELGNEKFRLFIDAWGRTYYDLPVTTDQLAELATSAGFSLGSKDTQRAHQMAVARLVRNSRDIVVDGWRIEALSCSKPTTWRLKRFLGESLISIEDGA